MSLTYTNHSLSNNIASKGSIDSLASLCVVDVLCCGASLGAVDGLRCGVASMASDIVSLCVVACPCCGTSTASDSGSRLLLVFDVAETGLASIGCWSNVVSGVPNAYRSMPDTASKYDCPNTATSVCVTSATRSSQTMHGHLLLTFFTIMRELCINNNNRTQPQTSVRCRSSTGISSPRCRNSYKY